MKATELMVGDWVLDGKKPAQITGIMCDDLFETTLSPSVGGECISPIPLTPEILKDNGFKKGKTQYYQDFYEFWSEDLDRCIYLYVYEEYFLLFDNSNANIKYVHELQHALRLCGINKEIEI